MAALAAVEYKLSAEESGNWEIQQEKECMEGIQGKLGKLLYCRENWGEKSSLEMNMRTPGNQL